MEGPVDLQGFWIPSVLMGFGIAIDVTLATLAKFRDKQLSIVSWSLPIAGTHIAFPALGYFVFWGAAQMFPWIEIVLGIAGFVLVALFVYEVFVKSIGETPIFGISDWLGGVFGLDEDSAKLWIAILAVSWDALWSGPAKAAQAAAGHWTTGEVIWSFLVAGVTVFVVAQLALFAALRMRSIHFTDVNALARFNVWGKFVELSVIGGFGVLSLRQGLASEGTIYSSIAIAAIFLFFTFLAYKPTLLKKEAEAVAKANATS